MTTTTANTPSAAIASRDALCIQALRMLRTTAQQWGMCLPMGSSATAASVQTAETPSTQRVAATARRTPPPAAASGCAGLRMWRVAA